MAASVLPGPDPGHRRAKTRTAVPRRLVEPPISSAAHEGFSVMVAVAVSTPNVVLRVAVTVAS